MAVRQVREGWVSTLLGQMFDSEIAAREYDRRAALELQASKNSNAEFFDSLSPEQVKALSSEMLRQTDENANLANSDAEVQAFLADVDGFLDDGANGNLNAGMVRGYLAATIGPGPYSRENLLDAFEALQSSGSLYLKKGVRSKTRDAAEKFVESHSSHDPLGPQPVTFRR